MARNPPAKLLLVEDDPSTLSGLQRLLSTERTLTIQTAGDGPAGWELAKKWQPDLILSDYDMPGFDGFELCRRVKRHPKLLGTVFVVLTGYGDSALKVQGLNIGVDDYLTKPFEAAELIARVRAMLRIKSLHDEIRREKAEIEDLHKALAGSFDHLLALLVRMLDLRVPGAEERGNRLAWSAQRIAHRMDVPERFLQDLELAARLHEIGRIADLPEGSSNGEGSREHRVGGVQWSYVLAAEAILQQVTRFESVARLVGDIAENWDGTGLPNHLLQGQIPLRARILRTLIDFLGELEAAPPSTPPIEVAQKLGEKANTYYDPLVVTQLQAIVKENEKRDWRETRRRVPVSQIKEGMVLAEDLITSSAVKLFSRGGVVTSGIRDIILRRHVIDPIIHGVWVQQ